MPQDSRTTALAVVMAVLLVATGVGAGTAAAGMVDEPAQERGANGTETTITVSATGDAAAEPDLAVVRVAATAVADDPSNATTRLAENASRLRTALRDAGLAEDQVRTTGFNVFQQRPDERPVEGPAGEAVRYVAQQGFEVTVDPDRAGEIVDVAVSNGASEVQDVTFTLSEERRAELRNEALSAAMADARAQAGTVAAAEDLALVAVQSVSTGEDRPFPAGVQAVAETADAAGTEIDAGPVTVTATVQVTYAATETLGQSAADNGTA